MPRLMDSTRAARRERILRAAVACFARRGYHATTMEDIAAAAGIAKGAPYVHFDGKEAIFLALYDGWSCALREEITAAVAALPPAERASARHVLRTVAEVTGKHVTAEPAACRVLMEGHHLAAFVPTIAARVAQEQAEGQRQIAALLQAGVAAGEWPATSDVSARATLVWAALHGLMATWHLAPGSFDWRMAAAAVADW
jgi:AcrR family transcriptional regulator